MYKVSKDVLSSIITELFKHGDKQNYNLGNNVEITMPTIATVYLRTESISFSGSKIWNALPDRLKSTSNLDFLNLKWNPENCQYWFSSFIT